MLKQNLVTFGFILTLVVHAAAVFDMNSWYSSYEYDSLESPYTSEEYDYSEEVLLKRRSRDADGPNYITCDLEQLPFPIYKTLDRIRYEIYHCLKCRNMNLLSGQKINIQGKPNLKYIMFEKSTVATLPEEGFTAFTNFTLLYQLYLNDSSVNSLTSGAFMGLSVLEELYLQNNNITRVLKFVFSYLPHLKLLNLSFNNISLIQENAFSTLLSLRVLYLNNNNLKIILDETFNNLKYLRYVDLSNNHLLDVSHLLFYTVGTLNFRYNNLSAVDFSGFPTYLEQLFLDNNQISYIENLKKIENVVGLSITNNNIANIGDLPTDIVRANFSYNIVRVLTPTVFNHAINLATLDLSYNLIENLSEDHFGKISSLKEIYFQNNHISVVPDGCFRNLYLLKLLNLSNNYLTDFKYGTFSGLTSLEYLDISNNKAGYIHENSFYGLKNLKVLNIAGNFLHSLNPNDIINNSRKLTLVTLDNNPWLCRYLTIIVRVLQENQVNVTKGSIVIGDNVNGIKCTDHIKFTTTTVAPSILNISSNAALDKLQKISNELKIMRDFFDQDFVNTTFYKYFETFKNIKASENFDSKYISNVLINHFDNNFKNTTFYKYLSGSDSLESISNISKTLRALNFENAAAASSTYASTRNQNIFLKISELQTGITTVMIIVIIMLLSIIILFIIQKFSRPVNIISKSVFRKRSLSAEIELI